MRLKTTDAGADTYTNLFALICDLIYSDKISRIDYNCGQIHERKNWQICLIIY